MSSQPRNPTPAVLLAALTLLFITTWQRDGERPAVLPAVAKMERRHVPATPRIAALLRPTVIELPTFERPTVAAAAGCSGAAETIAVRHLTGSAGGMLGVLSTAAAEAASSPIRERQELDAAARMLAEWLEGARR